MFMVLDRYADTIGSNIHTLIQYRHVAHAWPPEYRVPGVPWSVHHALESLEDRFEVIQHPPGKTKRWNTDMALRVAGRMPNRPLTKEEKLDRVRMLTRENEYAAGAVEEMIRRPDVAHKVMASPENQRILYRAHHEQRMEAASARFAAAQERYSPDEDDDVGELEYAGAEEDEEPAAPVRREPAVDYQRASREVLELIGSGTTFLVDLQRMIPRLHVGEFTDREVRAILDNHRRIRAALDWCDSALATGDKTMDEELARILSEGDDTP